MNSRSATRCRATPLTAAARGPVRRISAAPAAKPASIPSEKTAKIKGRFQGRRPGPGPDGRQHRPDQLETDRVVGGEHRDRPKRTKARDDPAGALARIHGYAPSVSRRAGAVRWPPCTNRPMPLCPRGSPLTAVPAGSVRVTTPPNGAERGTIPNSWGWGVRGAAMGGDDVDVRLERVTKEFNEVTAVDDLDLDIQRGEFFSMLGPSGCGKTTTLRMIGGFEEPSAGTVYLNGEDVTGLPPYKRDVNTVFQSYALFPHLDVYENVAFGLRRKKVERGAINERVMESLRLVDLPGLEKRKPSQLSGGQQQRVALARALVNHPQVLLLDEPLGALDLKLRKQMQLELKRIQAEVGITFIYVTHDQEEAMTMSDRLAVMRHGRI